MAPAEGEPDAGPTEPDAEPAKGTEAAKVGSQPRRHAVLVFNAPPGTRIVVDRKQILPGHRLTVVPGTVRYEFACPGRRGVQTKTVHLSPSEKPQTIGITCPRR
jgi:hypothetical protein